MFSSVWVRSFLLVAALVGIGAALAAWKAGSTQEAGAASAHQPEPMESVRIAVALDRQHAPTVTSIGTVTALRSITLRNEIAGTVESVKLASGQIVPEGAVLVRLDASVERAELAAQEAEAALAETSLERTERAGKNRAASQRDVDIARASRDVALAQVARTKAIIAKKTLRAPFRARVGIADVHPGQYLNQGTELTTLQGVGDGAYVDFAVAQRVAEALSEGEEVQIYGNSGSIAAKIVAIDARIDSATRNATVRALMEDGGALLPGASVRVVVRAGQAQNAVAIPVSALRKGPTGDHVFLVAPDKEGKMRAHLKYVESGVVLGDEILVHSGLSSGDRVAASGSFKLRDAVLVAVGSDAGPSASK